MFILNGNYISELLGIALKMYVQHILIFVCAYKCTGLISVL